MRELAYTLACMLPVAETFQLNVGKGVPSAMMPLSSQRKMQPSANISIPSEGVALSCVLPEDDEIIVVPAAPALVGCATQAVHEVQKRILPRRFPLPPYPSLAYPCPDRKRSVPSEGVALSCVLPEDEEIVVVLDAPALVGCAAQVALEVQRRILPRRFPLPSYPSPTHPCPDRKRVRPRGDITLIKFAQKIVAHGLVPGLYLTRLGKVYGSAAAILDGFDQWDLDPMEILRSIRVAITILHYFPDAFFEKDPPMSVGASMLKNILITGRLGIIGGARGFFMMVFMKIMRRFLGKDEPLCIAMSKAWRIRSSRKKLDDGCEFASKWLESVDINSDHIYNIMSIPVD